MTLAFPKPRKVKRQRRREGDSESHLANLRKLPCCACGEPAPSTVHHLKQTGQRGISLRSPDRFGIPLCWWPRGRNCHGRIEQIGSKFELEWLLAEAGVDGLSLAEALWANRFSLDAMRRALLFHTTKGA